ncbi:MAG: hypothetical protein MI923_13805 [Phycisphaerales bacterium]|nr:hypothetical protein [Phycisphaerales bacterium]
MARTNNVPSGEYTGPPAKQPNMLNHPYRPEPWGLRHGNSTYQFNRLQVIPKPPVFESHCSRLTFASSSISPACQAWHVVL